MESTYNSIAANDSSPQHRLSPLVTRWTACIQAAKEHRKKEFDDVAEEARKFFSGPSNHFWKSMATAAQDAAQEGFLAGSLVPQFKLSINRMFDAVAMFGPALYHQNPSIAVTSRAPLSVSIDTYYAHDQRASELLSMIPSMQAGLVDNSGVMEMAIMLQEQYETSVTETERLAAINNDHAVILQSLSNYYQNEGDKQDEARLAITEAIVTGLGLLETVMEQTPGGGPLIPSSRFISNRDFICDPDASYWRDVTWIGIRRCSPVNIVEARFGLPPGSLKGRIASNTAMQARKGGRTKHHGDGRVIGASHDLIEYWDIYSKNGAGQRLKLGDNDRRIEGLDVLGDFVYLAICDKCPYPLNLPDHVPIIQTPDPMQPVAQPQVAPEALEATAWPAPFWDDLRPGAGWPVSRLTFYQEPGKTWPISMCKACLPEMKFINWCMSFLADGVAVGSKIYPAALKSNVNSLREQLAGGQGPFTVLELEQISGSDGDINKLVSFLKAPQFNIDIWNMIAEVNDQIDKRLGLTELMYGLSSRQMRSAAEAQYRQNNISIRPDDMASRVEDWLSTTATREIQMLRWKGGYDDVAPIVGPVAAQVFETQILTQEVSALTRDFAFRVEAGTARKPNKDTRIAQLNELSQYLMPFAQQAAQMGITKPYNAFMEDLGRAMDIDVDRYMLDEQDQQLIAQYMAAQQAPAQSSDDSQQEEPEDA